MSLISMATLRISSTQTGRFPCRPPAPFSQPLATPPESHFSYPSNREAFSKHCLASLLQPKLKRRVLLIKMLHWPWPFPFSTLSRSMGTTPALKSPLREPMGNIDTRFRRFKQQMLHRIRVDSDAISALRPYGRENTMPDIPGDGLIG